MKARARKIAMGAALLAAAGVLALSALPRVAPVAAPPAAIDRILVDKSERRLELLSGDAVVRSYEVALGFAPEGDKQQEGDGRTPEGR
jgi:murein L,D-transpeptidase YafK